MNTFATQGAGLSNQIEFRVPKPDGGGYWQNNLEEVLVNERGPQGKASFTVGGKMCVRRASDASRRRRGRDLDISLMNDAAGVARGVRLGTA